VKERPILFSAPMVQAILADRKSQTRRIVDVFDMFAMAGLALGTPVEAAIDVDGLLSIRHQGDRIGYLACPYGEARDRLWVRETWCPTVIDGRAGVAFAADAWTECPAEDGKWRPSIFMRREACRIELEVVSVRVERVRQITEADAKAEGVASVFAYASLWDSLNAKRGFGWSVNPLVWVVEFRRVLP